MGEFSLGNTSFGMISFIMLAGEVDFVDCLSSLSRSLVREKSDQRQI
jgi:hypothetical protein